MPLQLTSETWPALALVLLLALAAVVVVEVVEEVEEAVVVMKAAFARRFRAAIM